MESNFGNLNGAFLNFCLRQLKKVMVSDSHLRRFIFKNHLDHFFLFFTRTSDSLRGIDPKSPPHSGWLFWLLLNRQWAAVTTCLDDTKLPPQNWRRSRNWSSWPSIFQINFEYVILYSIKHKYHNQENQGTQRRI